MSDATAAEAPPQHRPRLDLRQVQRMVLSGYDTGSSRHLLLEIVDAAEARRFLARLLNDHLPTFGDRQRDGRPAVDVGFTCAGLATIGVAEGVLNTLRRGSPAFAEGAAARAAQRLGDFGRAAAEHWPEAFHRAHVWLAVHGDDRPMVESMLRKLVAFPGAEGLRGWDDDAVPWADALRDPIGQRLVHFGFVDGIAKPRIARRHDDAGFDVCAPGELLLGHRDDNQVDFWIDDATPPAVAAFLRHGSFGVLRRIEQDEAGFRRFVDEKVAELRQQGFVEANDDWLKAKICGRWPNGAPVEAGIWRSPELAAPVAPGSAFDPVADAEGLGCPFGAHVRRSNPRGDPLAPPRLRTVFRRGMPYGPRFDQDPDAERGLIGIFVGASIEDQFERVLSEWIEKSPMGPPASGRAKDPLVGRHDEPAAEFHIPQPDGAPPIALKGMQPFVTTRGTIYTFLPSRAALHAIAGSGSVESLVDASSAPADRDTLLGAESTMGASPDHSSDPDAIDAPADRFCDIVMEGGITSGIIYAGAVAELSRRYRFKNIGGSSIGAFAAALTAAAEWRRRNGSRAGFDTFDELPTRLAEVDEDDRTKLEQLFVPQPGTRRLFAIFLAMLNRGSGAARMWHGARAAFAEYRRPVLIAWLLFALVVAPGIVTGLLPCAACGIRAVGPALTSLLLAVLALPAIAVAVVVGAIAIGLTGPVVRNGFGLCRGWSAANDITTVDLAAYLHGAIQEVAGLHPLDDRPLSFNDLWTAPGGPSEVLGFPATGAAARSIDLEVYSSNLSHGRPYRFPLDLDEDPKKLYFRPDELREYFPAGIVQTLVGVAVPAAADIANSDGAYELPLGNLPIVVAVRLAMSFPLLISAVPLWAVDDEPPRRRDRVLARCWMSDGGLCSNFPIHLFDSFLPKWPTFGISLENRSELRPQQAVWLPDKHTQGAGDTWNRGLLRPRGWGGALGGFLASLWTTTWRWNDSTMMRMPGVRDRVVRIYLRPGEGGVNIRMSMAQIQALSRDYGRQAGRAFIAKFAEPASPGWHEHRWVRFADLTIALRDRIAGFGFAAKLARHVQPMAAQIREAAAKAPLRSSSALPGPSEQPLEAEAVRELEALLAALEALEAAFDAAGDHPVYDAVPTPALRMRHPT